MSRPGSPTSSERSVEEETYHNFTYEPISQLSFLQRPNRYGSSLSQDSTDTSTIVFFVTKAPRKTVNGIPIMPSKTRQQTYNLFFGPRSKYNKKNLTLERAVMEGMRTSRWVIEEEAGEGGRMPVLKIVVMSDCQELTGYNVRKAGSSDGMKDFEGVKREAEGLDEDGVRVCFEGF